MATTRDRSRPVGSDYSVYPAPAQPAAADVTTELAEFRRFLEREMTRGVGNVSVDAVLAEFRLYQEELRRMRESLQPALERSARGEEARIWNKEEMWAEVRQRLVAKGIDLDQRPEG